MEEVKQLTPMKAIRKKCLDCCCGSSAEVKECQITACPLWIYRSGHRPNPSGTKRANEKQIEALRRWRENNSSTS